ncbi:hypothetical protein [Variovorax rhizosphaerae]|uniref:Uncharacterized protein n=1 Tax=Variovorax rhizosphaerae TaxID=1836200 RepID=A0ABU8WNP9_9BURK
MLDSINQVRDMSPLRKLLLAVLLAIVLAQAVAMALIAQSQVRKAEWREAAETQRRTEVAQRPSRPAVRDGLMTVGYTYSR